MEVGLFMELGLTEQEAKIYLALISLGKASASQISAEAKVSYGTIYALLAQMERKGLVKTIPEKTKKFVATNPQQLVSLVAERERKLHAIRSKIREITKIYESEVVQPVLTAQGKTNFFKLKSEMTPHKFRDYSVRPIFSSDPVTYRKMKERVKNGVDYKILFGPNASKKTINKYHKEKISMRKIPIDNTIIAVHDNETLITLLKKNTTILIRDKDFSDLMAWFFNLSFS